MAAPASLGRQSRSETLNFHPQKALPALRFSSGFLNLQPRALRRTVQYIALAGYDTRLMQYLLGTSVGRASFEAMYFCYKDWIEAPGTKALAPYIQPGDWVIDVGANIGYFARKFARWVKAGGKVLALEPEQRNYSQLQDRLAYSWRKDRVIALRSAAADVDGTLRLRVNLRHPGDHSLSESDGVPVQVRRLDLLWAEYARPNIALLKIDVQGAELQVLRGAIRMIEACHPVLLLEIDEAALAGFATHPAEVLEFVRGHGYSFHRLTRSGISPFAESEILSEVKGPPTTYCDVLALPDRRSVRGMGRPC